MAERSRRPPRVDGTWARDRDDRGRGGGRVVQFARPTESRGAVDSRTGPPIDGKERGVE